jgi:hypothetical protein
MTRLLTFPDSAPFVWPKNWVRSVCLILSVGSAQSATAESVVCRMDTAPAPAYIAPEISLQVGDRNDVFVKDAVIASTGRERVIGKVSKDDGRRLAVVWEISEVPAATSETRAYSVKLQVRLSISRADGAARITLVDTFYLDKSYISKGMCRFSK